MDNNNNKKREKRKANRNLYLDQITSISIISKTLHISDSKLMRIILDRYIDEWKQSEIDKEKENQENV